MSCKLFYEQAYLDSQSNLSKTIRLCDSLGPIALYY